MAKIYMVDDTKKNRGAAALNTLLYPQVAAPLDTREVFYSLEDFKAYVRQDKNYAPAGYDAADIQFLKDIAPYSYAGQVVAVVSGDVTTLYKIDKVGGDVEGVNYSAIGGDVAADLGALTGRVGTLETTVGAIPSTYQTQAIPSIEGYASASTVKGALEEVMSKAMSNAGGITAVEGRVGTAEASIKAMQSVLDAVPSTYATKEEVNELSSVYETIANVDSKLENYYTSAQTDAKFETIANVDSKLANYYTKKQADEKHEEVVEIAQGKTQTFVVNYADNAFLNSQDAELNVQQFFTIDGKAIAAHLLKPGDVILVVETDVPDRWVKQVNEGDFVLAKLETTKVDLEPYATINYVDEGISKELLNYISGSISTVDKLVLVAGSNQIKETEYTIINSFTTGNSTTIPTTGAVLSSISNAISDRATKKSVSDEASAREAADNALGERITAEESARVTSDQALGKRIDDETSARETLAGRVETLEAMPFNTYASVSYVDTEISKVAAAATKVEKSDTNGNILVDGVEVVVYNDNDGALAERVTNAEASIAANAEAIGSNAEHFTELQGTVASIDTRVTNLETTVEGIPSIYATKEELSTEANTRAEEDGKLATRLSLVEESLGLRDPEDPEGGDNKGIAEQIAAIKAEIWGTADMSESSRIDKLEMADIVIGQRIDGINSKLNANLLSTVSGGQYVSGSISGNNLTIDDHLLVSVIDELASNPVVSVAVNNEILEVKYHSDDIVSYNLIEGIFGVSSIASNAKYLLSSATRLSALYDFANCLPSGSEASKAGVIIGELAEFAEDDATAFASQIALAATWVSYNTGVVSNLASNAITSVQTSTLVMSHSGNNLMINLPSVIWLDGGSASDTYEAEEAVYNELLNNEYGN